MSETDKATGDVAASPQVAQQQQDAADWPSPGEEGYVHPDGTPQSQSQLEDNRRAAADRAAAGSTVHGAPMATPGPNAQEEAAKARQRAESYSGPTAQDAADGVTKAAREPAEPATAADATGRTADEAAPRTRR